MSRLAGPGRTTQQYIGPITPEQPGVELRCRKIPSEEWQRAHPPGVPCDPPEDKDMVVQVVVLGMLEYQSRIKHPRQWDRGRFPVVELSVTPWLTWKAAADADIARQKGEEPGEPEPESTQANEDNTAGMALVGEDDKPQGGTP